MASVTNRRAKMRLLGVTVAILLVVVGATATVGASGSSRASTVAEASRAPAGERVKLSGKVSQVEPSGSGATFILSGTDESAGRVTVHLTGPPPSTLGTGVEAMLTGTADGKGNVSEVSDLVIKCPSKYESASGTGTPPPMQVP